MAARDASSGQRALIAFLDAIDEDLARSFGAGQHLDLYLLGGAALILGHDQPGRVTKDVDVVDFRGDARLQHAEGTFGRGSGRADQFGFFLETVGQGLPPMPNDFRRRCRQFDHPWRVIRAWLLDPNDLAVTKLKSFRPQDRRDIQFLCDRGLVRKEVMEASLEKAFLFTAEKDGDPDRERAFANLRVVADYLDGNRLSV